MVKNSFASLHDAWRQFRSRDDGQVAVIFALALLPLVGGVGAAVDYSRGSQVKTGLQGALDSAVLAAAIDGGANWQTAALNTFTGNVNSKSSVVGTPTFKLEDGIYSGSISASLPTSFIGVIGVPAISINAKSAATTSKVRLCVLGLNSLETGSFDMNGNSQFNAPDCAVQANTQAAKGMTQEGSPKAVAKSFGVTGGHTGDGYSKVPKDGAPNIPDPYASTIPFPSYTACDKNDKGLDINSDTTLSPGTYCGGVRIKSGAKVTLNAGIYVMASGSLWLDGGSSLTGKEVVIAFTGADATLRVWGNSTLNLTSPELPIFPRKTSGSMATPL